eukprot:6486334-Amphidinium_carterae.1
MRKVAPMSKIVHVSVEAESSRGRFGRCHTIATVTSDPCQIRTVGAVLLRVRLRCGARPKACDGTAR